MARIIQIKYSNMRHIARDLHEQSSVMKKLMEGVRDGDERLRRGGWQADAADDFFRDLDRSVYPGLERLTKALDNASSTVLEISRLYQLADIRAKDFIPQTLGGSALDNFLKAYHQNTTEQENVFKSTYDKFDQTLKIAEWLEHSGKLKLPGAAKWLKKLGPFGGVIDFALGGEYTLEEGATQILSGGIQYGIASTGVGAAILVADAGIQILGEGYSYLVKENATWLANGDPTRTSHILETANKFDQGLKAISLDNRIDGLVNSAITLDGTKAVHEVGTLLLGTGQVLVEGTKMTYYTVDGITNKVLDSTTIDETLVEGIENAKRDVGKLLDKIF
jgi:uncharacterized protein YukE